MRRTIDPAFRRLTELSGRTVTAESTEGFLAEYLECWGALYAAGRLAELLLDGMLPEGTPNRDQFVAVAREPIDAMVEKLAEQVLDRG